MNCFHILRISVENFNKFHPVVLLTLPNICQEIPHFVEYMRHFTGSPRYVFLLAATSNGHKSAPFDRNCIGLLGKPRRFQRYANAQRYYITRALSYFTHTHRGYTETNQIF